MARRVFSALVCAALLLSVASAGGEAAKEEGKKGADVPLTALGADEVAKLPDRDNPKHMARLKCSACLTSMVLIDKRLGLIDKEFKKQPEKLKRYHVTASVDGMCGEEGRHIGLLRNPKTREVYPRYVDEHEKEYHKLTIKGGWVSTFWQDQCDEVVDRTEDDLYDIYKGKKYDFCPVCGPVFEEEEKMKAKEKELDSLERKGKVKVPPRNLVTDDELGDRMPDPEHPINKKWLQCTICQTTLEEVDKRFKPVHMEFDRQISKVRSYHLSAALEELCEKESLHYGLLREEDNTKIYPRYVDETRPEFRHKALKGDWVTNRWKFHCEELMEKYEDEWLAIFKGTKKPDFCPVCKPLFEEEKKRQAEAEARKKAEEEAAGKDTTEDL